MSSWYTQASAHNDIAVSTRIRLARNLSELPFPSRMTDAQRDELKARVKSAINKSDNPLSKTLKFIDMQDVPENERYAMVERHVISPDFASADKKRAIILSDDESISIMIGEEDHIRIQVILAGLSLKEAYSKAEQIDKLLFEGLSVAFDSRLGYLTECPTNLGTGLRASLMLHLPMLESLGDIPEIAQSVGKIGFTVRGMYGEGTKSNASMYQISNQITLGLSEGNALENLQLIATQLTERERRERQGANKTALEDISFRALGILQNCRILSSEEMMDLLSKVKLGINMGIINTKALPIKLLIEGQPNMLMKKYGNMGANERDIYRANFIREQLR